MLLIALTLVSTGATAQSSTTGPTAWGPELVSNGSFADGLAGWAQFGVVLSGGQAVFDSRQDVLAQTFAVIANQAYQLSFDYRASGRNGSGLQLDFAGRGYAQTPNLNLAATSGQTRTYVHDFVAQRNGITTLTFTGRNNRESAIDHVSLRSVSPVPEPAPVSMLLAGLGAIGFLSQRRRPAHAGIDGA
ncbi:PEP-CTERM sorting domain-containing protein [Leptothrix discophora]|uniref:PEP-CTERM sorting domain-containing protein n=1 Tax=Leptothrix discophora TaxID=89 RepID=A0ABT9FYH8_LEPDI|nr:PEP-CTERM sorting domain-containing protein [Leptothrix discophora]MDP4299072.1 PEP-CTERM sorting domain-containing protein [Leptothrix discophora]